MTRRERLEAKLEKRREWADKAGERASARFKKADSYVDGIPMGQPILVGHHSEKRHRKAIERCHANGFKGVEELKLAKHHESKADGLECQLDSCVFADDPDAIEALTAKIEAAERKQEQYKAINRAVKAKPRCQPTPEKIAALVALGLTEANAQEAFKPDIYGRYGIPSYALQNNNANIRRMRLRIKDVQRRQAKQAAADASENGVILARHESANWATVTFSEKPERSILQALRDASYHFRGGSWQGYLDRLPACVAELEGGAQ